jgi:heme-degrading monooxygenase HmoA
MYVTRTEATVVAGRATEYLERTKRNGELMGSQQGFLGRLVLNSFGYPAKYATLTTWENREDPGLGS